ncbi:methyltransferase domain-containing protein [Methylobacterium fujisawaense]|uniref:methyltransferase domain-containing protein n=1 Tax=Methylobacterium fujisawaense TaxID=107400 RepID=UPI000DB3F7E7
MDRVKRLLSMLDTSGIGLEVGPGYNPLLKKSDGFRVETVDHGTAEQIREKYRGDKTVDISQIEEVDFVWDGRPLSEVIGKSDSYDYIVASHVIEHTTDLIGFLKECQILLKSDGILLLAVPDKRRCFDVLQAMTTTGAVLQAHFERRTRHSPGLIFDYVAYGMLRDGAGGWPAGSDAPLSFAGTVKTAYELFERARESQEYIDAHAWRFTPSSFRMILKDLHEIGAINFLEQDFHGSDIHEFYISLSKNGTGCPLDRLSLAKETLEELGEITFKELSSRNRGSD